MAYHWYLELLKLVKLPAYDGVEPFLKQVNTERKKKLQKLRSVDKSEDNGSSHTPGLKRMHKRSGVRGEGFSIHMEVSKSVDPVAEPEDTASAEVTPTKSSKGKAARGQCKCGSRSHLRTSHRDCPLNSRNRATKVLFSAPQPEGSSGSEGSDESDVEILDSECMSPVLHEEELATSSSDDDVWCSS